jgi:hypothetical protein
MMVDRALGSPLQYDGPDRLWSGTWQRCTHFLALTQLNFRLAVSAKASL